MLLKSTALIALVAAALTSASPVSVEQRASQKTYLVYATTYDNEPLSWNNQVSFYNNSLYVGNIRYNNASEPLILTDTLSFTSYHQSPTGAQALYLYPHDFRFLGLTIPHTGYVVPEGATSEGFSITGDNLIAWKGNSSCWWTCTDYVHEVTNNVRYAPPETDTRGLGFVPCWRTALRVVPYGYLS